MIKVSAEVITVASKEWSDLEYRKQSGLDFEIENPYLYVALSLITTNICKAYGKDIGNIMVHTVGFMYKTLKNQFDIDQMEAP